MSNEILNLLSDICKRLDQIKNIIASQKRDNRYRELVKRKQYIAQDNIGIGDFIYIDGDNYIHLAFLEPNRTMKANGISVQDIQKGETFTDKYDFCVTSGKIEIGSPWFI